jgi:TetR/AcrR family transcriptional repressor of nem operon
MARPIEYDKNEVLNNAMETFWRYGYESTSMKMLVKSTGLTTRSMYNLFESKNGLFKAALSHYYHVYVSHAIDLLTKGEGLEAIRQFALAMADFLDEVNAKISLGCLFTNTMSEKNSIDDVNYEFVDRFFDTMEKEFNEKLVFARENESYSGNCEIRSKQLVALIQGLSIYAKNHESQRVCRQMVEDFLELCDIV